MRALRPVVLAAAAAAAVTAGLLPPAPADAALRRAPAPASAVRSWLTTADGSNLLRPVNGLSFGPVPAGAANPVVVDPSKRYQVFRGAGASLTESSAAVLSALPRRARDRVMLRLFSPTSGIGLSMLRQPLGATDFSLGSWTYDDVPAGAQDPALTAFSTVRDERAVRPLVRRAAGLNPALRVVASAWTAPAWMKTSGALHGGALQDAHVGSHAAYLARSVADARAAGVPVSALTLGNEPGHQSPTYPTMHISLAQQRELARRLPGALRAHGVADVALLGHDHNWDDTATPRALLADPQAGAALRGVAFHCYAGEPRAQAEVAAASPSHEVWMTECSGGAWSPRFADNLNWNAHTLLMGNLRNAGSTLLLWNLALDPRGGPTNGGCTTCRGVVTVDPSTGQVRYEVEYYVLGQLTKAVRPGAVRIGSTTYGTGFVESVAFRNVDGTTALVLHNNARTPQTATVVDAAGRGLPVTLAPGAVQTLLW